jgi:succinate dehydrogenase hydrophobic anchor subunit
MGLRSYVGALFVLNPIAQQNIPQVQDLAKGVLDFIRNLAVVGVMLFFAEHSKSRLLMGVTTLGFVAIAGYLSATLLRHHFNPFSFVQRQFLREGLNAFANLFFVCGITIGVFFGIRHVIEEIARSQGFR